MSDENSRDDIRDDINEDFTLDDLFDEEEDPNFSLFQAEIDDILLSGANSDPSEESGKSGKEVLSQAEIDDILLSVTSSDPSGEEKSDTDGSLSQAEIDDILLSGAGSDPSEEGKPVHEVLSQAEIDNLLSVESSDPSEESDQADTTGPQIKMYDFRRPDRFTKENVRVVSLIHETCARNWSKLMESRFSLPLSFHNGRVDQVTFEEYIYSVAEVSLFAHCRFYAGGPDFVLKIPPPLIELLISRLAGSDRDRIGENSSLKAFTPLQKPVVQMLLTSLLESVSGGWKHIMPCEVVLEKIYYHSSEVGNMFPPQEIVILALVEFEGAGEGFINLVYPFSSLANIRSLLTENRFISRRYGGKEPSSGEEEENSLLLPDTRYQLYYEFPLKEVTLRQFLDTADEMELSLDPELKGKRLYTPVIEKNEG